MSFILDLNAEQLRYVELLAISLGFLLSISLFARRATIGRGKFALLYGIIIFTTIILALALTRSGFIFRANFAAPASLYTGLFISFWAGWLIGAIGQMRSNDAHGDSRSAWQALVPIANLFLWAAKAADRRQPNQPEYLSSIPNNILVGFVGAALLLGGRGLTAYIDRAFESGRNPFLSIQDEVQLTANSITDYQRLPAQISPEVELSSADADGQVLVLTYRILQGLLHELKQRVPTAFWSDVATICSEPLRQILHSGGRIRIIYRTVTREMIYSAEFSNADCDPELFRTKMIDAESAMYRPYLPMKIDQVTTLVAVQRSAETLVFRYIIDRELTDFGTFFQEEIRPKACEIHWYTFLLNGASVTYSYSGRDNTSYEYTLSRSNCAAFQPE